MTGSIKDRLALYILQKAQEQDKLKPGDLIVEASSGNSGIAIAAIGRAMGNRVKIIMPDWISREFRAIITGYGAEVHLVSKESGGFNGSIGIAEAMAHYDGVFLPRQFAITYQAEVHERMTGREIGHSLLLDQIKPAAFIAGVGTGGTVTGVGKYLRSLFPEIKVHPLEPIERIDRHRIYGICDTAVPASADLKALDSVVTVHDGDAILMAQKISKQLGMGVGISSGANLAGAIKLQRETGCSRPVITIFPDNCKKYMGTDLSRDEPLKEGYLSGDVRLLSYRVLSKV